MSDYYTESQVNRIEEDAYNGAIFEAGKEWERQRDEFNSREHELQSRIAELEAAQEAAVSLLPKLSREHYYCEDCWYSCPKATEGCCDESQGDECNCGADAYNAIIAEIVNLLTPPEVQE